jgi:hypothetical protein
VMKQVVLRTIDVNQDAGFVFLCLIEHTLHVWRGGAMLCMDD